MPTDNPSSPPRAPNDMQHPDELHDAAERLERDSWERLQSEARDHETASHPNGDSGAIMSFLEHQLSDRPLPTLLAAVAAGWLVGKLLR